MLKKLGLGLVVIAGLSGLTLWSALSLQAPAAAQPPRDQASTTAPIADQRGAAALSVNARLHQRPPAQLAAPGPLPRALQGAQHDVRLRLDEHGHLLIEDGILHLFDFYLSALEDEPVEQVLARIHWELARQLQGMALDEARDLLRRYVDYRIALMDLPPSSRDLSAAALRERLETVLGLRGQYFSAEENQAFFALEAVQDNYMLQRLEIVQQQGLSEQQRQQALAALDDQLPPEMREARARVTRHAELYATTQSLRQAGASAEDIYRRRAQALGADAAAKLAELDQQRLAWKQRLASYAEEREQIRRSGLSDTDQQTAIASMLEQRFDPQERLRVRALDSSL
ncbi:lipase secretion chaperone [Pseudomonas sp. 2FG]|uniref:lipase secretion chaperone n=1 Tax=Pseudomonas sp. 2FG TaxID=2502191 RepID=UPI0010F702B2|nr:lipase secretion chaperone [Pseudomonas sp. 2FG]